MFPWSPFAGIWQRTVDHLLPRGAQPGQVVVEPDLINSPEAMLRAVAAGSGVAPGILGVAEHMDVSGIVVLPLDPPLLLDLEVVWRRPARPAVRRLVDFLVEAADEPGGSRLASPSSPRRRGRPGLQDHLLAAVLLVLEDVVAVRGLGQGQPVGDHPGRVELASSVARTIVRGRVSSRVGLIAPASVSACLPIPDPRLRRV